MSAAPTQPDLMTILQQMTAKATPATPTFGAAPPGMPMPTTCTIPVKTVGADGSSVRSTLTFPGEFAQSPQTLSALLNYLANAGWQLDVYMPRQQFNGNGAGGNFYGGGRRRY